MSYPLDNAVLVLLIGQSNAAFTHLASSYSSPVQGAQECGYCARLYTTNETTNSWVFLDTWNAIQSFVCDGSSRCTLANVLAYELINTHGIRANIIHDAYGGQPLSSWIGGATGSIWNGSEFQCFLPWLKERYAELVAASGLPKQIIVLMYQGESGVGTGYSGTWDQGMGLVEQQFRNEFPGVLLRTVIVKIPPNEIVDPPGPMVGIPEAQELFVSHDRVRRRIVIDAASTFYTGFSYMPAGVPSGLHIDAPSAARVAVLAAAAIKELTYVPSRRSNF